MERYLIFKNRNQNTIEDDISESFDDYTIVEDIVDDKNASRIGKGVQQQCNHGSKKERSMG